MKRPLGTLKDLEEAIAHSKKLAAEVKDTAYVFATSKQFSNLPRFDEILTLGDGNDMFYGASSSGKNFKFIRVDTPILNLIIKDLIKDENKNDVLCFLEGNSAIDMSDLCVKIFSEYSPSLSLGEILGRVESRRDFTYDHAGWVKKQLEIFKEIGT